MFGGGHYGFGLIRKYVVLMGKLFSDIYVERVDSEGNQLNLIHVPLRYSQKEKMLTRVVEDPGIDRPSAVLALPLMSFELTGLHYRHDTKLTTTERVFVRDPTDPSSLLAQYQCVPYDFMFNVYVYVKNTDDGNQIIEQILPFFTPDFTFPVELIPETNEQRDIPIIRTGISFEDSYDGKFENRRVLVWTLTFTVRGYLYGPVKTVPLIKFTDTRLRIPTSGQTLRGAGVAEDVVLYPGVTSSNTPTSNASLAIPYEEVDINMDYGYVEEVEENPGTFTLAPDDHPTV